MMSWPSQQAGLELSWLKAFLKKNLLQASVQQVGAYSQLAHGRAVKIQPTSVQNLACTVSTASREHNTYLKHAAQPQSEILLWISVLTLQMALALELLQHLRLLFMMMLNLYMVNTRSQPAVVCDHFVCKLTTHLQHCKL
jgi:hypothetical protein